MAPIKNNAASSEKVVRYLFLFLFCAEAFGQTFLYGIPERIEHIHPFRISGGNSSWFIQNLVVERLFEIDPDSLEIKARLAKSWKLNANKKILVINLRKNVRWHDGKAFQAKDVKFSFDLFFQDKYRMQAWRALLKNIKSLEIIHQHQIKIHFHTANYENFRTIAAYLRVFPQHFYTQKVEKLWKKNLIGTGPYVFHKIKSGRFVELHRNSNWWGNSIYPNKFNFPKIKFIHVAEFQTGINLLQSEKLHAFPAKSLQEILRVRKQKGFGNKIQLISDRRTSQNKLIYLRLNLAKKLFQDHSLRLALNQIWDREMIRQKLFHNEMQLSHSLWAKDAKINRPHKYISFNPALALKNLRALGWQDKNKDGILENKQQKLSFRIHFHQKELEPMLSMYQYAAKQIGIEISLQKIDIGQVWKTQKEGLYDVYAIHEDPRENLVPSLLHSQGEFNSARIRIPAVDKMLEKLEKEFQLIKRIELQKKIIQMINQEIPVVFGYEKLGQSYIVHKSITSSKTKQESFYYWQKL